jgi:hypothetical protein
MSIIRHNKQLLCKHTNPGQCHQCAIKWIHSKDQLHLWLRNRGFYIRVDRKLKEPDIFTKYGDCVDWDLSYASFQQIDKLKFICVTCFTKNNVYGDHNFGGQKFKKDWAIVQIIFDITFWTKNGELDKLMTQPIPIRSFM